MKKTKYKLVLYIAGTTPKSLEALANIKRVCEEYLKGQYSIDVVDLIKNPKLAKGDQIIAIPTLIKKLPPPLKKIIGDFSNKENLLVGLNIIDKE
jgi:circadian clock protein KaiB